MYSGTSLTRYSGRVVGAHQKIDRVARKHLSKLLPDDTVFPTSRKILHFEGNKGPDALKLKSPAKDEPWHFFNPFDETDIHIHEEIIGHYKQLVSELKAKNQERISFEAAWLAHAIVDGLTPAHHYPYEATIERLRGGKDKTSRTSLKEKLWMPGQTRRERLKNNWEMWGPKGLMPTHMLFEFGVASIIAPLSFGDSTPTKQEVQQALSLGLIEFFSRSAKEIAVLDMYYRYIEKGWTPKLAYDVRHKLGPQIIKNVTLAWYLALVEAGIVDATYENHRRTLRRKNVRES